MPNAMYALLFSVGETICSQGVVLFKFSIHFPVKMFKMAELLDLKSIYFRSLILSGA